MIPELFHLSKSLTPAEIFGMTLAVGFVSGFVPLVNIEAFIIAAVVLSGPTHTLGIVVASAVGQMSAKSLLYLSGRGILKVPMKHIEAKTGNLTERLSRRVVESDALMFTSAFVGFPPFYVISVLAGMLKLPFPHFLVSGLVGRTLRFWVMAVSPQIAMRLWH